MRHTKSLAYLVAPGCIVSLLPFGTQSGFGQTARMPGGASVIAGQAAIATPSATSTLVTQSTEKALINWNSFSIGAGATVTFKQPDSSAIALNRVIGPESSSIFGNLSANGQVWLVNSNGILFGPGSQINVGALLATTSDIADRDFLDGRYNFTIPSQNPNAAIVNRGTIGAAGRVGGACRFARFQ